MKKKKLSKNPNVDTSFLPDREREEAERRERERLRVEWLAKQEEMKAEDIEITYSYWDGSGHRKSVTVSVQFFRVKSSTHITPVQERRLYNPIPREMSPAVPRTTRSLRRQPHVYQRGLDYTRRMSFIHLPCESSSSISLPAPHILRLYRQQSSWKVRSSLQL